jgi:TPR repeat protein
LYERAATLGDAESAMILGKWFRDGRGVTQSPSQALTWFKKAADLGHKDAAAEIKRIQK